MQINLHALPNATLGIASVLDQLRRECCERCCLNFTANWLLFYICSDQIQSRQLTGRLCALQHFHFPPGSSNFTIQTQHCSSIIVNTHLKYMFLELCQELLRVPLHVSPVTLVFRFATQSSSSQMSPLQTQALSFCRNLQGQSDRTLFQHSGQNLTLFSFQSKLWAWNLSKQAVVDVVVITPHSATLNPLLLWQQTRLM